MKRSVAFFFMLVFPPALHAQVPVPTNAITIDQAKQELSNDQLRVHFIDIGPGLAVLVQTPGDRVNIFIDGGKWGLKDMMKYAVRILPIGLRGIDRPRGCS
jgi:beta-lactamase superfamily II metal-dependent hydrolase